jgi:lipoprotein-releasing system permease protein
VRAIFYIAHRYFLSIHKKNIINIISWISLLGVIAGTMAMIIVLSTFNGFDQIVKDLYKDFDPDIKIEVSKGRFFELDSQLINQIQSLEGVVVCSEVLDCKMLAQVNDLKLILNIKGVDSYYSQVNNILSNTILGSYTDNNERFLNVGHGVFNSLSLKIKDYDAPIKLSFFQDNQSPLSSQLIRTESFYVASVFAIQPEFDNSYAFMNLNKLRQLLQLNNKYSAIEIKLSKDYSTRSVKQKISQIIGGNYIIKTQSEQRPFLYKMIKTEKLAVYIIFSFIVIISLLSLVASMIVLLMEKQQDIYILNALGFPIDQIKKVFFILGSSITVGGVLIGTVLGILVCFLQKKYQLIKLGDSSNLIIDSYPIKVEMIDIIYIQIIVITLGLLAAYIVSSRNQYYNVLK